MNVFHWKEKLQIIKQSYYMIGFWMTLRYVLIYLLCYTPGKDTKFDKKYGTDTSGIDFFIANDIAENEVRDNAIRYQSAPPRVTKYMIASLDVDCGKFNFIDFGSGKGRVVLVASEFPFRRIIGIEISEKLHKLATRNVEIYDNPAQRCSNIELRRMNATTFPIPETNTVFHFYHPFMPGVLRPVLQNIGESLKKNPRRIFILYLFDFENVKRVFDEMPFLKLVREFKCLNGNYNWSLYTNNP